MTDSPKAHRVLTEYQAGDIHLMLVDAAPLSDSIKQQIADAFNAHNNKRANEGKPPLHNSPLIRVHAINDNNITCVVSSYAEWIATIDHPEIFSTLQQAVNVTKGIEPIYRNIATSGAILSSDGFYMFGKRAKESQQFPNAWELCPSGCVNPNDIFVKQTHATVADLSGRLLIEMTEETRIQENDVSKIVPLGLFQAGAEYEGNFVLKVNLTAEELQRRFNESSNNQYTELKFVLPKDLQRFADDNPHPNIVSTTAVMIPHL